jgi:hypothetical protein
VSSATLQVNPGGAEAMLENFRRLWSSHDPEIVREIVAPEAHAYCSGLKPFRGTAYPGQMKNVMETMEGLELAVTGHAAEGDLLFISWRAKALIGGQPVEWDGIDRFRIEGDLAVDVHAIFDTGVLRAAYEASGEPPTVERLST